MKTHFAVIGAGRCGTQSMYHYLSQHPGIYMCPAEHQGFFAKEELFADGFPDDIKYESNFSPNSQDSLRGEVSAEYLFNTNCLARLSFYNPKMKIIALLRNPAERAYSHWQVNRNSGFESHTFREAIESELASIKGATPMNLMKSTYIKRGLYAEQVENLLQYFNPNQLLIIRSEDLQEDAAVILYQVFQFLDLPYTEVDQTPQNLGDYEVSMDIKDYNFLIQHFEKDIYQLEKVLGWNCNDWLRPIHATRPMMSYIEA